MARAKQVIFAFVLLPVAFTFAAEHVDCGGVEEETPRALRNEVTQPSTVASTVASFCPAGQPPFASALAKEVENFTSAFAMQAESTGSPVLAAFATQFILAEAFLPAALRLFTWQVAWGSAPRAAPGSSSGNARASASTAERRTVVTDDMGAPPGGGVYGHTFGLVHEKKRHGRWRSVLVRRTRTALRRLALRVAQR